jgi:hypothetical protein
MLRLVSKVLSWPQQLTRSDRVLLVLSKRCDRYGGKLANNTDTKGRCDSLGSQRCMASIFRLSGDLPHLLRCLLMTE